MTNEEEQHYVKIIRDMMKKGYDQQAMMHVYNIIVQHGSFVNMLDQINEAETREQVDEIFEEIKDFYDTEFALWEFRVNGEIQ